MTISALELAILQEICAALLAERTAVPLHSLTIKCQAQSGHMHTIVFAEPATFDAVCDGCMRWLLGDR